MANEGVTLSDIQIQWHAAFCAAAELELSDNREELEFQREYNLSKKPLQIDLLVVEKRRDVLIKSEFGRIFRQHNIIEYKSPGDELSIDDAIKAIGYACFYKSLGETVNQIPLDQLTVSLVREGRPRGLFETLQESGFEIKKEFDGIYYVKGLLFPVQIVVTRELSRGTDGENLSLRVLSRSAAEEDVRKFIEMAQKLISQGDRENVDAILQVSVSANYELYEKMKRRDPVMCEAIRRLMKDEIRDAQEKGEQLGEQKGILETLFSLVKDDILTIADAAQRANMKVSDFEKAYKTFLL